MASNPATGNVPTEFTGDALAQQASEAEGHAAAGTGPWRLAGRRLRRNKTALAFLALFFVVLAVCLCAPIWAHDVAHTTPSANHLSDTISEGGKQINVVRLDGVPIGPQWLSAHGRYFLGADANGRDIMVRLLYGGRTSLEIGFVAVLITVVLSVLIGLIAGYFRGWVDAIISRILDIIWAYPVLLLGVALGTALALGGFKLGPLEVSGNSLAIVMVIIGFVYVPYMARPIRGQVLSLREKEFVDAAVAQGAGPWRIMLTEILPNVSTTVIVFFPLLIANAILLEAALSFLGAGVQPPNPSWGTMISDGIALVTSAPHLVFVPGLMLILAVLALNVFGDGLRDALDPRAKVRVEH